MDLYVISGATGMTGNELSRQIVTSQNGDYVIGFDNFFASSIDTVSDIINYDNFDFYEYDLTSHSHMDLLCDTIDKIRDRYEKLIFINCAAVVHTEHFYHIDRTFFANVEGMRDFLDRAVKLHADIFINCSTSEVYSMNSWRRGGVAENDYLSLATAEHSQRTSYATGKLLTEFFMKDAVERGLIAGCSIRFANVYSKNELYPKHIIPHILTSLYNSGCVELLENSKINKRTFLHNIDSCSAVLALVKSPSALDGTVYNVATDEEISIIDLVSLCAAKLNIDNPQITFNGYRASDPERRLLNTEKIRSRTSWRPVITLERGIEMCVQEMNI